jgi:hypothetical protein
MSVIARRVAFVALVGTVVYTGVALQAGELRWLVISIPGATQVAAFELFAIARAAPALRSCRDIRAATKRFLVFSTLCLGAAAGLSLRVEAGGWLNGASIIVVWGATFAILAVETTYGKSEQVVTWMLGSEVAPIEAHCKSGRRHPLCLVGILLCAGMITLAALAGWVRICTVP